MINIRTRCRLNRAINFPRGRSASRTYGLALGIVVAFAAGTSQAHADGPVWVSPVEVTAPLPVGATAPMPKTPSVGIVVTGSFGIRVIHQPLDDVSDPRGFYYIVARVKPGAVVHRRLEINNQTGATGHFLAYAAAAVAPLGQFIGAPGRTQNQLSSWTAVSPSAPVIRSGAAAAINVTVAVPWNAAPGARYGVVWAQMQGTGGAGITLVSRVGIRIYFTVLAA